MTRGKKLFLLLAGLHFLCAYSVPREGGSKKQPTLITALGSIEFDQKTNVMCARGHASIKQGETTLYADTIYGSFVKSGEKTALKSMDAVGNVKVVLPKNKIVQADKGHYEASTDIITLMDNVRATDKGNQLVGSYAIVNRKTGVTKVLSAPPPQKESLAPLNQKNKTGKAGSAPRQIRVLLTS